MAKKAKSNPKDFWKYVNSRIKTSFKIDTLVRSDGSLALSDLDKANELNHSFSSVFTSENTDFIPSPHQYSVVKLIKKGFTKAPEIRQL